MILTCPNCATRYLVDPASIGLDGRQVRCANCYHERFEPPPSDDVFEEIPVSIPEPQPEPEMPAFASSDIGEDDFEKYNVNLPAVVEKKKAPAGLILAFCAMLLITWAIAGTVYHRSVMKYLPFTRSIYSGFGLYPTTGITLTDVVLTKLPSDKTPAFQIDCKFINTTKHEQVIPDMRVSLLDKDGSIITRQMVNSNQGKAIAPGERVSCDQIKVELTKRSQDAQKVRLDIGNSYDLFIRQ